jgi:hypothetical protein
MDAEEREKLLKLSPDTKKLIGYRVDEKTMLYFKKSVPLERVKEKIALYKKSLTRSSDQVIIFHNSDAKDVIDKINLENLEINE